jgi:hypothetical protein
MSQVSHNSIIQVFVQAFFLATFLDLHKDASKPALRLQQNTVPKNTVQTATSNSRSTPTITSRPQPFKMTPHHHPQIHYNKPVLTNLLRNHPNLPTHTPKTTPITKNVQSTLPRVPRLRLHLRHRPSPTLHPLCRRCEPGRNSGRLHGPWSPSRREL